MNEATRQCSAVDSLVRPPISSQSEMSRRDISQSALRRSNKRWDLDDWHALPEWCNLKYEISDCK